MAYQSHSRLSQTAWIHRFWTRYDFLLVLHCNCIPIVHRYIWALVLFMNFMN